MNTERSPVGLSEGRSSPSERPAMDQMFSDVPKTATVSGWDWPGLEQRVDGVGFHNPKSQ